MHFTQKGPVLDGKWVSDPLLGGKSRYLVFGMSLTLVWKKKKYKPTLILALNVFYYLISRVLSSFHLFASYMNHVFFFSSSSLNPYWMRPLKNVFHMYIMAMSTGRTGLHTDTLWGTPRMMQRLGYLYELQVMTFWLTKAERLALSFCQRRKIICVPINRLKKARCDGNQSRLISPRIKDPQIFFFFFCSQRSPLVWS